MSSEQSSCLLPAERMALTIAKAQVERGDNPPINTTTVLVMALERLTTEGPLVSRDQHTEQSTSAGAWEVLLVLVSMADDNELAALESTLDDESRADALTALRGARQEVEAQIASYRGEG